MALKKYIVLSLTYVYWFDLQPTHTIILLHKIIYIIIILFYWEVGVGKFEKLWVRAILEFRAKNGYFRGSIWPSKMLPWESRGSICFAKCSRELAAGAFVSQNAPLRFPREHLHCKCSLEFTADNLHWETLPLTFRALELPNSNRDAPVTCPIVIFFRSAEFDCPWVSF